MGQKVQQEGMEDAENTKRQKDGGKKINTDAIYGRDSSIGFWALAARAYMQLRDAAVDCGTLQGTARFWGRKGLTGF
jgi:hypothetical protein